MPFARDRTTYGILLLDPGFGMLGVGLVLDGGEQPTDVVRLPSPTKRNSIDHDDGSAIGDRSLKVLLICSRVYPKEAIVS